MKLKAALVYLLACSTPARAAVCDWSGYRDWARGWNVACSEDITWEDAATLLGTIVFDWTGSTTVAWLKEKFKDIGQDIATDIILDLIQGNVGFANGLQVKAAALSGTQCYHCPTSWFCYDQPNRHRVCIAYRDPPYGIYIKNDCTEKIQVAVRYLDPSTESWTSKCWYHFDNGEGYYLAVGNSRIKTTNPVKYVYAETLDRSIVWKGSDSDARVRDCRGRSLNMIHKDYVDSDGDLYTRFTCNRRRFLGSSGSLEVSSNSTRVSHSLSLHAGSSKENGALVGLAELPPEELTFKHDHPGVINPECDNDDPCEEAAGNLRSFNEHDGSEDGVEFTTVKTKLTDGGE